MSVRVIAYGGGVQSTALLTMAAQGKLGRVDAALFCNVGDDSEHPDTLRYVREVAVPYGAAHGVPVHVLDRVRRNGQTDTLWQHLMRPSRAINIPVRMANGAPGNRSCTADFKIKVMARWVKAHGATADTPATTLVGISWDEAHRAERRNVADYERLEYPLVEQHLSRYDCQRIIQEAGLEVPGKSSCFFCPFHCHSAWTNLKRRTPELFDKAVQLERTLNERRRMLERDEVYLTRFAKPLDAVVDDSQLDLFDVEDSCPSGHCWT